MIRREVLELLVERMNEKERMEEAKYIKIMRRLIGIAGFIVMFVDSVLLILLIWYYPEKRVLTYIVWGTAAAIIFFAVKRSRFLLGIMIEVLNGKVE